MPSVSGRQHRFMEMIAHDPAAAKRLGVSQSVGHDFVEADRGRKFEMGGNDHDQDESGRSKRRRRLQDDDGDEPKAKSWRNKLAGD